MATAPTPRRRAWPQAAELNEAVQNLAVTTSDAELQGGEAELSPMGLPMPYAGNFADVYKVHCPKTGNTWAVKLFKREVPDLTVRYQAIRDALIGAKLPFMVEFDYLERGVRVGGEWYPILKMRWVEGETLNRFVAQSLGQPKLLDQLFGLWIKVAQRLHKAHMAHADLQHGNVVLVPDTKGQLLLKLVDYDGMFVPKLAKDPSSELGHGNYQHPERSDKHIYSLDVDRFSHLAICCALRCLRSGGKSLWERFNTGENLLFTAADYARPKESALFRELWTLRHPDAHALTGHLILATQRPLAQTPLLEDLVQDGRVRPLTAEESGEVQSLLRPDPASVLPVSAAPAESAPVASPPKAETVEAEAADVPAKTAARVQLWSVLTSLYLYVHQFLANRAGGREFLQLAFRMVVLFGASAALIALITLAWMVAIQPQSSPLAAPPKGKAKPRSSEATLDQLEEVRERWTDDFDDATQRLIQDHLPDKLESLNALVSKAEELRNAGNYSKALKEYQAARKQLAVVLPRCRQLESEATTAAEPEKATIDTTERTLFDGKVLEGWLPNEQIKIDGGAVVLANPGEKARFVTADAYQDFELSLQAFLAENSDGGILLGLPANAGASQAIPFAQCNLGHEGRWVCYGDAFGLDVNRRADAKAMASFRINNWNDVLVRRHGGMVQFFINGLLSVEFDESHALRAVDGHIGLEFWFGNVKYRNVRIKRLAPLPVEIANLPTAARPGEWVDLLQWADGHHWAAGGYDWNAHLVSQPASSAITLKKGPFQRFPLPAVIDGNYELEIECTPRAGLGNVAVMFPLGDRNLHFDIGAYFDRDGVAWVDGKSMGDNGNVTLRRPTRMAPDRGHKFLIRVERQGERAAFHIDLDGTKDYIQWEGPYSSLANTETSDWKLSKTKHVWLGGYDTEWVYHSVRLRMLSGEVRRERILPADRKQDRSQGFVRLVGETPIDKSAGHPGFFINQMPLAATHGPHAEPGECERYWPFVTAQPAFCHEFYRAYAPSTLWAEIPQEAKSFSAVGYNQASRTTRFLIQCDGAKIYDSGVCGLAVAKVNLPPGAKSLELVVDAAGNSAFDRSSWCYPRFHRARAEDVTEDLLSIQQADDTVPFELTALQEESGASQGVRDRPLSPPSATACDEFVFAHATSSVFYAVPAGFYRFRAVGYCMASGHVSYQVWADSTLVYESSQAGIEPIDVQLPRDTKLLQLRVNDLGDPQFDWSMWCYPRLYRDAGVDRATIKNPAGGSSGSVLLSNASKARIAAALKALDPHFRQYKDSRDTAKTTMLRAFDEALAKARAARPADGELVKRLEAERAAFDEAGYMPFSQPMRDKWKHHLSSEREAEGDLRVAFERQVALAFKAEDGDVAAWLREECDRRLEPREIARWGDVGWSMLSNGKMAGPFGTEPWKLEGDQLLVHWRGPDFRDTCKLSMLGDRFDGRNQRGGNFASTWTAPLSGSERWQPLMNAFAPPWQAYDMPEGQDGPRLVSDFRGRKNALQTHPLSGTIAGKLRRIVDVPRGKRTTLKAVVSHHPDGDWRLVVRVNGLRVHAAVIGPNSGKDGWTDVRVDLSEFAGQKVVIELLNEATGWHCEYGYWQKLEISSS